jgi:hypothetical protein
VKVNLLKSDCLCSQSGSNEGQWGSLNSGVSPRAESRKGVAGEYGKPAKKKQRMTKSIEKKGVIISSYLKTRHPHDFPSRRVFITEAARSKQLAHLIAPDFPVIREK